MEKLLRRMFDGYPVFMKQTFQIVEWAIVVVAMEVAAAKLGLPLVQLVARALYFLLCFHVGVQSEQLVAWARNGKRPPAIQGILLPLLAASVFGSAVTYLTIVLGKISLSS